MTTSLSSPAWFAIRRELENATQELFAAHKLEGWKILFENVSSRAGQCNYTNKTISYGILFMLHADREQRMNTVLHEIAHAIAGAGHGHDAFWKRTFISLGGNGERSAERPASVYTTENYLWIGVCPTCGDVTGFKRAPQTVWGCVKCPKHSPVQGRIFEWKKNHVAVAPADISAKYAASYAELAEKF